MTQKIKSTLSGVLVFGVMELEGFDTKAEWECTYRMNFLQDTNEIAFKTTINAAGETQPRNCKITLSYEQNPMAFEFLESGKPLVLLAAPAPEHKEKLTLADLRAVGNEHGALSITLKDEDRQKLASLVPQFT